MRNIFLDADSSNSIKKISFYSPSQGFVATTKWIGYSTDSGRTFTKNYITLGNVNFNGYSVNLTFGFSINGVKAFNKDTVIAYGDYGLVPAILYSTDGCATFKLVYHSQFNSLTLKTGIKDIIFPQNNAIGYAVDADRILKTTNKGLTWNTSSTLISAYYDCLEAVDNNNVIAFSTQYNNTSFKKTTNGGTNWTNVTMPALSTITIYYANFYSSSKGWLNVKDANNLQYMYYTSNGGLSWRLMNNTSITPFRASKMQFINDSTGYAISNLYNTYITTDTGKLWQPIPKNNTYAYYYATHNHLQILNNTQLWSGGEHGFLEINTNINAAPIPKAYFAIDTTGIYTSNIVKLNNYSKQGYQYAWYKNDVLISNNYNTTYTHVANSLIDTIKLVVTNSVGTDTAVQYAYFNPPVIIKSFSPTSGETNDLITINGSNFLNATKVLFGGVAASSFTVVSNSKITADVGVGASGNVTVVTTKNAGSLVGFTYLQPPTINIPFTVSKNILCKSESISITIPNSQLNVRYRLMDSIYAVYGTAVGNGSSITLNSSQILRGGTYTLVANNVGSYNAYSFTNTIFLTIEKTKSAFVASKVNVEINEPFNVVQQSTEAQTFNWSFGTSANILNSNLSNPQNIFYSQTGLKSIQLISTSANGCKDTLLADGVFVYTKPSPSNVCYTQNIDDSDFSYVPYSPPTFAKISLANNNGYFVSGYGNKPILKSRYGIAKRINEEGSAYLHITIPMVFCVGI